MPGEDRLGVFWRARRAIWLNAELARSRSQEVRALALERGDPPIAIPRTGQHAHPCVHTAVDVAGGNSSILACSSECRDMEALRFSSLQVS